MHWISGRNYEKVDTYSWKRQRVFKPSFLFCIILEEAVSPHGYASRFFFLKSISILQYKCCQKILSLPHSGFFELFANLGRYFIFNYREEFHTIMFYSWDYWLNVNGLKPLLRVIYISLSLHKLNIRRVHPIKSSVVDGSKRSSEVGTKPRTQHYVFCEQTVVRL